jgi:hypothetical protein
VEHGQFFNFLTKNICSFPGSFAGRASEDESKLFATESPSYILPTRPLNQESA